MRNFFSQQQPGQSLIELIIAMAVIVVGLAGAASLVFSNLQLQERSADRVAATNLAREGIELAKAVRDSNWVAGGATAFDLGLYNGTDYTGVPRMDGGAFIGFDFTPNVLSDSGAFLKVSTNTNSYGLFVQGASSTGVATSTPFARLVTLSPICSDYTTRASGTSCSPLLKVGIRATSAVLWSKRGKTYTSTVSDDFYDWR